MLSDQDNRGQRRGDDGGAILRMRLQAYHVLRDRYNCYYNVSHYSLHADTPTDLFGENNNNNNNNNNGNKI